jgi:hypothetical protein
VGAQGCRLARVRDFQKRGVVRERERLSRERNELRRTNKKLKKMNLHEQQ